MNRPIRFLDEMGESFDSSDSMSFITLQVHCDEDKRELIIAELSLFAFDAFEENDLGVLASCEATAWNEADVKEIFERYRVAYDVEKVEKVNWNEEWEKNYKPVVVGDQCIVRAAFHEPRPDVPYEIIVTPKMSFGTGHHATTSQVLKYQLELEHQGLNVLDVGCGTGVLAIMAQKRGAKQVKAIDIDEWCIENSSENLALNHCENIELELGGIDVVSDTDVFDIILANINKNVLLAQIRDYAKRLAAKGTLVLSGFYTGDVPDLIAAGKEVGLSHAHQSEYDNWAMLVLNKQ